MGIVIKILLLIVLVVPFLVVVVYFGYTFLPQRSDQVCVREPGNRWYKPDDMSKIAKDLWEYAVLSENVYVGEWEKQSITSALKKAQIPKPSDATSETYSSVCVPERVGLLPLSGWKKWEGFPDSELIQKALELGLYFEVWEKECSPPVIAVVFRGTESTSLMDWSANLHFLLRIFPFNTDQYTAVYRDVGKKFVDRLASNGYSEGVQIVATGHSLGGGLAQHFAYSLPPKSSNDKEVPRVSKVFAFNPSPITGWFTLWKTSDLRNMNAKELKIARVFEHGEILAFIRFLNGWVYPPGVREIRYNFVTSANPFKKHSMRLIACALINASGEARLPQLLEQFQGHSWSDKLWICRGLTFVFASILAIFIWLVGWYWPQMIHFILAFVSRLVQSCRLNQKF